jgi:CheY-like chemotaxis protein
MSRILVVENDTTVRSVIRHALTNAGHEVRAARNGREALALFPTQPDTLVITDLIMSEVDGVETIHTLRKLDAHVPIIAISGEGQGGDGGYLHDVRLYGASEVPAKPVSLGELLAAVDRLLTAPHPRPR